MIPTLLLSSLVWVPMLAAIIATFMPERTADQRGRIRLLALAGSAVALVLAIIGNYAQVALDTAGGTPYDFEETHPWITGLPLHADYHLGADGVSLPLLLLSTAVFTAVILASWKHERRVRLYCVLLLAMETGVDGTLASLDYVLLLFFWALTLVALALLIAVWGSDGQSARRLLGAGGLSFSLLLLGMLLVALKSNQHSFDFALNPTSTVRLRGPIPSIGFWLTFFGFAVILPVIPFHTWFRDVLRDAGAPAAALVTGLVSALAGYGLIRVTLLGFSGVARHYSLPLALFAVVTAVWATFGSVGESRLRGVLGYTAMARSATVLLAIASESTTALEGAVLMLIANGFTAALLMLLAGAVSERTRGDELSGAGGLAWQAPRLATAWSFAVLAAIGVPFLAGFAADVVVVTGAFSAHPVITVIVVAAQIIVAINLVVVAQRIFLGPARDAYARARDASSLELAYLAPLIAGIVLFGLLPGRVIPMIAGGARAIATRIAGG